MNLATPTWMRRYGPLEIAGVLGAFARARFELRGTMRGPRVRCFGRLDIPNRRGITIGDRVAFLAGPTRTSLRCEAGAELVVGGGCIINYGALIAARQSVRIGQRCMLASYVHVSDDDGRRCAPIAIGDDVWLAYGAVIEPGTVVGNGCVVATLAVVSGVVPPDSLVAGNPAQVVPLESSRGPVTTVPGALAFEPRQAPADSETVRQAILVWFDDTRCFGDAAALITSDTMSLREAGLLDSLGVIQLIAVLEKRFRVAIDRERAAHPSAHTLRGFVECVLTAQPLDGTGSGDMFVAGAEDE